MTKSFLIAVCIIIAIALIVFPLIVSYKAQKNKIGTKFKVHLPEKYSDTPGTPVDAVVVDIPFKESFNANTREVVKG